MAQIIITITDEQLKAINGIVVNAEQWLQDSWNEKANSCMKKIIKEESKLNPSKMTAIEKSDWILTNSFLTRVEKDIIAEQ